ncbi:MAG TPA: phosphate-starvation-inducible PsiE family protein [Bryobacteraceae bacterium]|nr:phosphate-starvation-inducible PsiE family protein [Bryobacteraceae bacterium]
MALRTLILLLVAGATVMMYILFVRSLPRHFAEISTHGGVLTVMQTVFADVLAIVLGLELSETLKAYFAHRHVRLEVILVLATIAAGRNLIQVDYEHTSAVVLLGWGFLILCLTTGYLVVKKANVPPPLPPERPGARNDFQRSL